MASREYFLHQGGLPPRRATFAVLPIFCLIGMLTAKRALHSHESLGNVHAALGTHSAFGMHVVNDPRKLLVQFRKPIELRLKLKLAGAESRPFPTTDRFSTGCYKSILFALFLLNRPTQATMFLGKTAEDLAYFRHLFSLSYVVLKEQSRIISELHDCTMQ
jgi:hypothetical protein